MKFHAQEMRAGGGATAGRVDRNVDSRGWRTLASAIHGTDRPPDSTRHTATGGQRGASGMRRHQEKEMSVHRGAILGPRPATGGGVALETWGIPPQQGRGIGGTESHTSCGSTTTESRSKPGRWAPSPATHRPRSARSLRPPHAEEQRAVCNSVSRGTSITSHRPSSARLLRHFLADKHLAVCDSVYRLRLPTSVSPVSRNRKIGQAGDAPLLDDGNQEAPHA